METLPVRDFTTLMLDTCQRIGWIVGIDFQNWACSGVVDEIAVELFVVLWLYGGLAVDLKAICPSPTWLMEIAVLVRYFPQNDGVTLVVDVLVLKPLRGPTRGRRLG